MASSTNQRKAQERERKRALGLVRKEYWIKPEDHKKIMEYIKGLNR